MKEHLMDLKESFGGNKGGEGIKAGVEEANIYC